MNVLWQIWKSRNQMQFNREGRFSGMTVHKAVQEWLECLEVNTEKRDSEEVQRV